MNKEEAFQRWYRKFQVQQPSGCWVWIGSKDKKGYGRLRIEGKLYYATSIALWLYGRGELGMRAFHTCGNPSCVNPGHLRVQQPAVPQPLSAEERERRRKLFLEKRQRMYRSYESVSLRDNEAKFT